MKVQSRKRAVMAISLLALPVGGASWASACVPVPLISLQPRASGPAGAQVKVDGIDFAGGVTEVRWNALDGPLLARGSAGNFTVSVTIPPAEDGFYSIVALVRMPDASVGVKAVTPFQVTAGAPRVSAPGLKAPTDRPSAPSTSVSRAVPAGLAAGALAGFFAGGVGAVLLTRRWRPKVAAEGTAAGAKGGN